MRPAFPCASCPTAGATAAVVAYYALSGNVSWTLDQAAPLKKAILSATTGYVLMPLAAVFAEALRNNQRGDNYTVLTIGFATVLFFGAIAGRMGSARAQATLLGLGWIAFIVLTSVLLSFPKLI